MNTLAEGSTPMSTVFDSLTSGITSTVGDAVTAIGGVIPSVVLVLGVSLGVGLIIRFVRKHAK